MFSDKVGNVFLFLVRTSKLIKGLEEFQDSIKKINGISFCFFVQCLQKLNLTCLPLQFFQEF